MVGCYQNMGAFPGAMPLKEMTLSPPYCCSTDPMVPLRAIRDNLCPWSSWRHTRWIFMCVRTGLVVLCFAFNSPLPACVRALALNLQPEHGLLLCRMRAAVGMGLKALLSAASDRDKSLPAPARSPGLELHSAHVRRWQLLGND